MAEPKGHFSGEHAEHTVLLYALSTCIWCRKTRQLLEETQVSFDYIYLDLLEGEERRAAEQEVRQWNPAKSFPTLVIDGAEAIVGFKPDAIREKLEL